MTNNEITIYTHLCLFVILIRLKKNLKIRDV